MVPPVVPQTSQNPVQNPVRNTAPVTITRRCLPRKAAITAPGTTTVPTTTRAAAARLPAAPGRRWHPRCPSRRHRRMAASPPFLSFSRRPPPSTLPARSGRPKPCPPERRRGAVAFIGPASAALTVSWPATRAVQARGQHDRQTIGGGRIVPGRRPRAGASAAAAATATAAGRRAGDFTRGRRRRGRPRHPLRIAIGRFPRRQGTCRCAGDHVGRI